jgi:hypothetical protein
MEAVKGRWREDVERTMIAERIAQMLSDTIDSEIAESSEGDDGDDEFPDGRSESEGYGQEVERDHLV